MTPAAKVSSDIWRRLARAHLLGARLGEETLTDLLVLDMLHFQHCNAFRVCHPTTQQESRWGADLLVWIRRRSGLSQFLAIQAKKLYPNGRYEALNHHVNPGVRQIDRLDAFAHQYRAIPLYLLYNHFVSRAPCVYWHCCKPLEVEQLGCTLVPSWKIGRAIMRRGERTFTALHETGPSRPWRCAFDCDNPERQLMALSASPAPELPLGFDQHEKVQSDIPSAYPKSLRIELPHSLFRETAPLSNTVFDDLLMQMDERSGTTQLGKADAEHDPLYPRKLLIVDYVGPLGEGSR